MHEGRKSISKSVSVLVSKARQYVLLKQPRDVRRPRCFLRSHYVEESRTGDAKPSDCCDVSTENPTRYLQWGVPECFCNAFRMRQTLRLAFWWHICGRREGRVYVVIREQPLDDVELPSRDRVVKQMDSTELRRRVGERHSCFSTEGEGGSCSLFYTAEANCKASWRRLCYSRVPLFGTRSSFCTFPVSCCAPLSFGTEPRI